MHRALEETIQLPTIAALSPLPERTERRKRRTSRGEQDPRYRGSPLGCPRPCEAAVFRGIEPVPISRQVAGLDSCTVKPRSIEMRKSRFSEEKIISVQG